MATPIANASVSVTVTDPTGMLTTVVKTTDAQGKFTVSLPLTKVGNWIVRADYAGVQNQYQASTASTTITALAAAVPTTMTLVASSQTGTVGDTITLTATLQA